MTISISKSAANEYIILLGPSFDFNNVSEFRSAYEKVDTAAAVNFVIDFRNTNYMDSSALGMLINMKKYWEDKKSIIRIINTSAQVKKIFSISRFDKKFIIE